MDDSLASMERLVEYASDLRSLMGLVGLCSVRMYVAMLVMPPMSEQVMQGTVRNGLPLCVGLFVAWGQPLSVIQDITVLQLAVLTVKEALIGMMLGFAVATVFWVAEGAGSMIDNVAGFNNVQQTNPSSSEQSTPLGNILSQLAICGFYMLGGLVAFVGLMFDSYSWWPIGEALPRWDNLLMSFLQFELGNYILSVARLAAPVLLTLVLIDLSFGLLAKMAEKLEPNSLAQPVKGAVAVLMLSFLVGIFFREVRPELALLNASKQIGAFISGATR